MFVETRNLSGVAFPLYRGRAVALFAASHGVTLQRALTSQGINVNYINTTMFNIRGRKTPTPLEQFLMDYVWAHPDCTAETCREGLASQRKLKDSTVRTILRKLEEKGYATHDVDGRTFVYRAVDT